MDNKELTKNWIATLGFLKNRHFQESVTYGKFHKWTGIPLVILAALSNAGIWAIVIKMDSSYEVHISLLLAAIGTVITVLSAVQAFLSFDKRSEMHKNAAMKYSSLSADLEILLYQDQGIADNELKPVKEKWNTITENAPVFSKRNKPQ